MNTFRPLILTWVGLLVLLALQVGAARLLGWAVTAPFFGLAMATVVAVFFMHADEGPGLIRVFVFASAFWLLVLLSLGMMDPLTRSDVTIQLPVETAR